MTSEADAVANEVLSARDGIVRRRIMIVDDTPENLTALAKVLRLQGYEVVTALSGERALQVAGRVPPDMVLLDVCMPNLDGYAVASLFREDSLLRAIPIIFISAATDTEIKVRAFTSGGVDFISKPFEPEEVLARVRLHLALRTVEDHLEQMLEARTRDLVASESRYRTLVEALHGDYFFYTRDKNDRVIYASQSVSAVLGYTPEEFLACYDDVLFPALIVGTGMDEPWVSAKARPSLFLDAKHKDGTGRNLEVSEFRVTDPAGQVTVIEGIAHDITNHRRIQTEMRKAKDLAEAGSQAKSAFLAMISHEIRTPLNGIIGTANLLERSLTSGNTAENITEYIRIMVSSARMLFSVLNNVLDMSKMEAGTFHLGLVPFNLPRVVAEVFNMTEERAKEKNLSYSISIDKKITGTAIGDPVRVMQVVQSLVENAIKFTEVGRVQLRVSCQEWSGSSAVALVEVIDTGIGIDARHYDRLFRPFSQVDMSLARQFGGTGLGLATARHLVELMGGEIDFDSEPGRGSRFWFTLRLQ